MKDNPIVEQARQAGQEYIDSFHGDWKAIIADLRHRSEEAGRQVIATPPKRPLEQQTPRKGWMKFRCTYRERRRIQTERDLSANVPHSGHLSGVARMSYPHFGHRP